MEDFYTFLHGKIPTPFLLSTVTSHHIDLTWPLGGYYDACWPFLLHGRFSPGWVSRSWVCLNRDPKNHAQTKPPKTTCAGRNQKKKAWNIMELLKIRQCSNHGQMLQPPLQYLNSHGCHLPLKYNQQHQFRDDVSGTPGVQFTTWTPVLKPPMNISTKLISSAPLSSPPVSYHHHHRNDCEIIEVLVPAFAPVATVVYYPHLHCACMCLYVFI